MDDSQFRRVLDFFGLSWKGYRRVRKGVKKRLVRYMQEHDLRGVDVFLSTLDKDPGQRTEVKRLLSVSISRFFRDRKLWRVLEETVLPEIVATAPPKIKVWSAGCARGEEAYSFRILWEEWKKARNRGPDLELWATDLNPEYLSQALNPVYSLASLKEVPEEWRARYFTLEIQDRWRISENFGKEIFWRIHNLAADPPPTRGFLLIFLRNNLLTYYSETIQEAALAKVIASLSRGGFLILGSHEKLPRRFSCSGIEPTSYHPNIYFCREKEKPIVRLSSMGI